MTFLPRCASAGVFNPKNSASRLFQILLRSPSVLTDNQKLMTSTLNLWLQHFSYGFQLCSFGFCDRLLACAHVRCSNHLPILMSYGLRMQLVSPNSHTSPYVIWLIVCIITYGSNVLRLMWAWFIVHLLHTTPLARVQWLMRAHTFVLWLAHSPSLGSGCRWFVHIPYGHLANGVHGGYVSGCVLPLGVRELPASIPIPCLAPY